MAEAKFVSKKTIKGVATITFDPERIFQGGGLDELLRAVEECAGHGERLHAVFFYPEAAEASEVKTEQPTLASFFGPRGVQLTAESGDLDKLLDSVRQLPQQVLGFAVGKTGTAGTCLLLACDVVLAVPGATLCLTEGAAGRPRAVPTEVLRRLGGNMSLQLVSAGGELPAKEAMQLGLVSEVCATPEALAQRRDELVSSFQTNPMQAAVSMKWLQRRAVHRMPVLAVASAADASTASASGGVKRRAPSASSATLPPSKRRRLRIRDTTTWLHDTVLKALIEEEGISSPTCQLVSDVVAGALLSVPQSRSQFHEDVIKMIGKALDGLNTKAKEFVDEVQDMLEGAEAEMSARKAAEASTESDIVSLRTTIRENRLALDAANEALGYAMQEEKKAQEEQEKGDSKYNAMNTEKERLQTADIELFKPAKLGLLTKAKAKKNAEALVKLGTEYGFEKSFLVGLPGAFSKNEPAKRSSFDDMVLTAFETQVITRVSELDQQLVMEVPGLEAREAMVQSAKLQHRAAKEKQDKARVELEGARKKEREAVVALQSAKQVVQAFDEELKKMAVEYACAKSQLDALKDGPLAAFEQLQRYGAAAVVPDEAVADEAADDKEKSEVKASENVPEEGSAATGSSAEAAAGAEQADAEEDSGTAEKVPELVSCDFGNTEARKEPEIAVCDFGTAEAAGVEMADEDTMGETSGSKSAAMDSIEAQTEVQATQETSEGAEEADKSEDLQEAQPAEVAASRDSFCTVVDPAEVEAAEGVEEGHAAEEQVIEADASGVEAGGMSTQETTQSGGCAELECNGEADQEKEAVADNGDEEDGENEEEME